MDHASSLSSALLRDNQDKEEVEVEKEKKQANKPPSSLVKPRTFKIIVLGESGVGKTCLSFRFCAGKFPLMTEATIGLDFREKVGQYRFAAYSVEYSCAQIVELDGERLKLQLWDTAGQERFKRSITHHYYRNVSAVVFVYDVTSVASLVALDSWLEEVRNHGVPDSAPRVLVGNKCDQVTTRLHLPRNNFCPRATRW